jgi:hypothetical protein
MGLQRYDCHDNVDLYHSLRYTLFVESFQNSDEYDDVDDYVAPFSRSHYTSRARRWASRMGLDYVVGFMRLLNKQIDVALQGVTKNAMSSSGFVTFLDLTSTCCAASAPLTVKSSVLHVSMAPEPRVCTGMV